MKGYPFLAYYVMGGKKKLLIPVLARATENEQAHRLLVCMYVI